MRAFIALELPDMFADDIAAMARVLSTCIDARFSPRTNYHLTLVFLGDIDEAESRLAMEAMDAACAQRAAISLRSDGIGKFGRASDATLWLGIAPDEALLSLVQSLREALHDRGVAFDDKPFRPHITLARRAHLPKGSLPQLVFPEPRYASRVTLFRSTLNADGAEYKPLYTMELE